MESHIKLQKTRSKRKIKLHKFYKERELKMRRVFTNQQMKKARKEMLERGYCVHAIKDVYKANPLISNWCNVHTHGLEAYNLTNISIVAPIDDDRLANVIYAVADMMKDGEEFVLNGTHSIDRPDGTCKFKFRMLKTKCFGEDTIRIILPDPITNKFFDEDGMESVYCLQQTAFFEQCENN